MRAYSAMIHSGDASTPNAHSHYIEYMFTDTVDACGGELHSVLVNREVHWALQLRSWDGLDTHRNVIELHQRILTTCSRITNPRMYFAFAVAAIQ